MVDAVTKDFTSFYRFPETHFDGKINRFLWAGMKDIRVLLLKIGDREHNLQTLKYLKDNKQVRMAFETQAIFKPLKKIIRYDSISSINQGKENFNRFIKNNNIISPDGLKKCLYNMTFNNFSDEAFKMVYRNSANVIWRVEGINMYKKILSLDAFKGNIDIISVKSNGKWLNADFKFRKGAVVKSKDKLKLSISTFDTR
jgi:hypothetical protein